MSEARLFGAYASWYDAFNQEKDYAAEADYLLRLTTALRPPPRSWLDLGCGTGQHLTTLQKAGMAVTGVDASSEMIEQAQRRAPGSRFLAGRADEVRLAEQFDVISMLFHVMSYIQEDDEICRTLDNVREHLVPDGVFVFDFWHTGGVQRDPPSMRIREALIGDRRLVRIARPVEDRPRRRIDVNYEFRWDNAGGALAHREVHRLRHFDPDELGHFLGNAGLTVRTCNTWMRDEPLAADAWYGVIAAQRDR
ncbi:MAG TPA: class I SAM-dependent methyltransferase [Thermoanaerobaculia bacterium]